MTSHTSPLQNVLPHHHTPASVATVTPLFCGIPELTPELKTTAAHAILWSRKAFEDPNTTSKDDGLDFMYLELHVLEKSQRPEAKEIMEFQNETHRNLMDIISPTFLHFLQL